MFILFYKRNGYAEKLQKILIRQTSSINFVKHHMNKQSGCSTNEFSKNLKKIVKIVPFFVQSSYENQFSLIHGIKLDNDERQNDNNDEINFAYLLAPNELLESESGSFKSLNNRANISDKKLLIKIYPPWLDFFLNKIKPYLFFYNYHS